MRWSPPSGPWNDAWLTVTQALHRDSSLRSRWRADKHAIKLSVRLVGYCSCSDPDTNFYFCHSYLFLKQGPSTKSLIGYRNQWLKVQFMWRWQTNELKCLVSILPKTGWMDGSWMPTDKLLIHSGHQRQLAILAFYSKSVDILMFMFPVMSTVVAYLSVYLHGCFRF